MNNDIYYISIIFLLILYILYINYFIKNDIVEYNIEDKLKTIDNFCDEQFYITKKSNLMKVHIVKVLSLNECNWIIEESEKYANISGWRQERSDGYKIEDIQTINISSIHYFIHNIVFTRIIKYYEKFYNIPGDFIGIIDCSIIKYTEEKVRSLRSHVDVGDISFIISLNDNFEGGYTFFDLLNKKYSAPTGSALLFCANNRHQGLEITKGTRYILVGFLNINKKNYCKRNILNNNIQSSV